MKRCSLAFLAACLLVLAGCGGGSHHTRARTVAGHACNPADYVQQCALTTPNATLKRGATPFSLQGIDFAWSAQSVSTMRANGWAFAEGYLSYDSSKNLSRSLINAYHAAGIATGVVWETSATRAAQGCSAGSSDAREAIAQLAALGAPSTTPFTMAIDFDASGSQVAAYFQCAHNVAGDRANAYGGYTPLAYLCAHHLVGHTNWQTYAWSGGRWLPASCAPLEQYLNGSAYDHDRAIAADYGQWGGPVVNPPKPPPVDTHHIAWYRTDVVHHGHSERAVVQLYRGAFPHKAKYPNYVRGLQHDLYWFAQRLDVDAWKRAQRTCQAAWPCPGVWDVKHRPALHQGWRARRLHTATHDKAI